MPFFVVEPMVRLCILVVVLLSVSSHAKDKPLDVPYSDILTLSADAPTSHIQYGDLPLQNIAYWQAKQNGQDDSFPAVVFIHGGCWLNQFDRSHSDAMSAALRQNGVDVYSLEYRRVGDEGGGWPGTLVDIEAGLAAVIQHRRQESTNENIHLVGHSAGGHLALLSAARSQFAFRSVIGLAAITDIVDYANDKGSCQSATPKFMGGMPKELGDTYAKANPVNFQYAMPVKLLLGTKDKIVPRQHLGLAQAAIYELDGAGHFDYLYPDSASFELLVTLIHQ